jgi:hypothetical protein
MLESQRPEPPEAGEPPDHHRETIIIVNAQQKTVTTREVTFEQVVDLAYDGNPPQGDNWVFTVTYRRGAHGSPQGSLVAGGSVKVKHNMVFNVTATDKS